LSINVAFPKRFRDEQPCQSSALKETSNGSAALLGTCFVMLFCLAYSLILKVEATYSSETLLNIRQNTKRYIPEDRNLRNQWCDEPQILYSILLFQIYMGCLTINPPLYLSQ
jgi:hypothetical protein